MSVSISVLKEMIKHERTRIQSEIPNRTKIYELEYSYLKKHIHLNIGGYIKEYNRILSDEIGIETEFSKLSIEEKNKVVQYFENLYGISTFLFKEENTVVDFKEPHMCLWIYVTKK